MTSDWYTDEKIAGEREAILRLGRLHWLHWAVVGLSLIITVGAWYFVKQQHEEKTRTRFQQAAEQILELASDRMQKYEDGLWGGVAAIQAHGGDIPYEDWRRFARSLHIETKYPGINGIGVIHQILPEDVEAYLDEQRRVRPSYRIHPEHDQPVYLPITYIEPSSDNASAVGLDVAYEPNRFNAALKARDTGAATITAPIVLVQDATKTPGFLFYAPFYADGPYDTVDQRRKHFVGMVYAPFIFHRLIEGVLGKDRRQVRIQIRDGPHILYDEHAEPDRDNDPDPLVSSELSLDLYGRTWTFDIRSTRAFRQVSASSQPLLILFGGITIDVLLLTLFLLLSRANRRAVAFADRVADQLHRTGIERVRLTEENARNEQRLIQERAEAQALELSLQQEREKGALQRRFVSMVSHEFRTPLAVIDSQARRTMRKLESLPRDAIAARLQSIRGQVLRMTGLMEQMLASARLEAGVIDYRPSFFNLRELIETVCIQQHEISPSHVIRRNLGRIPESFFGDERMLQQVFANLLSNAVKYSPDARLVEVSGDDLGGRIWIDVRDYGVGVPEDEVGELFGHCFRASTSDGIPGTGIGLHLVKSFVERHEGEVAVRSSVGEGSVFTLWLPVLAVETSAAPCDAAA